MTDFNGKFAISSHMHTIHFPHTVLNAIAASPLYCAIESRHANHVMRQLNMPETELHSFLDQHKNRIDKVLIFNPDQWSKQ